MHAQYLFTNCTIIDGAGSPSWVGEVAVGGGRILALAIRILDPSKRKHVSMEGSGCSVLAHRHPRP